VPQKTFDFTIAGAHVAPNTVKLRDLYELLHALEIAIGATASEYLGLPGQTDLHLTDIAAGSTGCVLSTSQAGYSAATHLASAIASRDLSEIPERARISILELQKHLKPKKWTVRVSDMDGMPDAEIAPDTEFSTNSIITGHSLLTGWLIRVGGSPRPTAAILLPDLRRLTVSIQSEELAKTLGGMLYSNISVDGDAEWTTPELRIVGFKITGLVGYDETANIEDALRELSAIAGDFWDDLDPNDYVSSLREDEG
jgi:hypothetical protein